MTQNPYMIAMNTITVNICPMSFGTVTSDSSTSLLAIEDWSGKVVP